jgi:uncharacterized membrane protein
MKTQSLLLMSKAMRIITFFLFGIVLESVSQMPSQSTIVSDNLYYVKFDSGSLHISTEEIIKIKDLVEIYSKMESHKEYVFIIYGLCSESEIKSDSFLGVKRSKILRDLFAVNYNINRKSVRIADDQIFPDNRKIYGVAYFLQRSSP